MPFDINDPETKAAVAELVNEATTALADKNKQLLAEVKKARKDSTIDPDAHAALESQVEELQGKLTQAEKSTKAMATEADKFKKLHESESAYTAKALVESGVRAELTKAGVTDVDMADVLLSKFASGAKVEVDGDNRVVKLGDKLLADAIGEWKATPQAAKFITSAQNSGGGSQGGNKQAATGKTMARSAFDALDHVGRSTFAKEGGKVVEG